MSSDFCRQVPLLLFALHRADGNPVNGEIIQGFHIIVCASEAPSPDLSRTLTLALFSISLSPPPWPPNP
jgi:hypothetical protein